MMRLQPRTGLWERRRRYWPACRGPGSYAWRFRPISTLWILLLVNSFMGMPYSTLMPIFASQVLHGDERTNGFMMGATGLGALSGAVYLASLPGQCLPARPHGHFFRWFSA